MIAQYLLNNHGILTPYKRCIDPVNHAFATYYCMDAQLDVCDICHEGTDWIALNLWRYPEAKQHALRKLLNLPSTEATVPFVEESAVILPSENDMVSCPSESVVESCVSCGLEEATCVGMDGESLCKRCWNLVIIMSKR